VTPTPSSRAETGLPPELTLQPVGYLRSKAEQKYQLPPQPSRTRQVEGVIELLQGRNYEVALRDLEGFSRIWLVWWFHKNDNWRPTTLPPRGRTGRVGTFASRSPYRPNPVAISNVSLLGVEQNRLYIGAHDLLDDTPILDIKPYIPEFDAFPDEDSGWYGRMVEQSLEPSYQVHFSEGASRVLATRNQLREKLARTLSLDPYPHRTRRIVTYGDRFRMACGDWRAYYRIEDGQVFIDSIEQRGLDSNPER